MTKEINDIGAQSRPCHCHGRDRRCYECEFNYQQAKRPRLTSDCIVVDSLLCSSHESVIAEITVPAATIGGIIVIGPGGTITPAITLTPDISNIVFNTTVVKNLVIITGYLPANVTILGIELPVQITIPFQHEVSCPGLCPEDNVTLSPFRIESTVTQGLEALGVSVASILFKVVLSTTVTATRQVIVKADDLRVVADVNENRCRQSDGNG